MYIASMCENSTMGIVAPVVSNLAQYILCEIVACRSFLFKKCVCVYVYTHTLIMTEDQLL